MEVFPAFKLISDMILKLFGLLDGIVFRINGYDVSVGGMLFVVFVVFMVVVIFWKGAKA